MTLALWKRAKDLRIRGWYHIALPLDKLGYLPQASLGTRQTVCHHTGRTWKGNASLAHPKSDGMQGETVLANSCFHWPLASRAHPAR